MSNHRPVYICLVYRLPDKKYDYIELLRTLLQILTTRHRSRPPLIIIAADFNYPQLCWHSDDVAEPANAASPAFLDILNDFHLHQFVHLPARYGCTSSSVMDLVLSSYPADIAKVMVERELSDHCIVCFEASVSPNISISSPKKIYLYRKGKITQLRHDLSAFAVQFF